MFKTSNGKYIAPQAIEAKLVVDRYIDQISIIADERKFVSALIIPEYKLVKEYAAKKGIRYESMEELLQKPEIIDLFKERIDTLQQYHTPLSPRCHTMTSISRNCLSIHRGVQSPSEKNICWTEDLLSSPSYVRLRPYRPVRDTPHAYSRRP